MAESTQETEKKPKRRGPKNRSHLWKPGQSGNPAGRKPGARVKLAQAFLEDVYSDWQQHGKAVLAEVRERRPAMYLQVVAKILPREINAKVDTSDLESLLRGLAAKRGDAKVIEGERLPLGGGETTRTRSGEGEGDGDSLEGEGGEG